MKELLPMVEHMCYYRHIYANMRNIPNCIEGELKALFWQTCKSGTPAEFDNLMLEINAISPGAHTYLREHNPSTYARAYFSGNAYCDAVENNMCETFNGMILDVKEKPLIQMLKDIRLCIMVRMNKKRECIGKWDEEFYPKATGKLEDNKLQHKFWAPIYNGDGGFEVKNGDDGYVVDFKTLTCSCRHWEINGIPCPHAVSAIYYMKDEPEKFMSKWYMIEVTKSAYGHYLKPLNGEKLWRRTPYDKFLPPRCRRMPGRPKKQRIHQS